jgi:hypothetical protein
VRRLILDDLHPSLICLNLDDLSEARLIFITRAAEAANHNRRSVVPSIGLTRLTAQSGFVKARSRVATVQRGNAGGPGNRTCARNRRSNFISQPESIRHTVITLSPHARSPRRTEIVRIELITTFKHHIKHWY